MRNKLEALLESGLKANTQNYVVYYDNNQRRRKSFKALNEDVDQCLERLNLFRSGGGPLTVGILGKVSYDWMVTDLACLKGGVFSVALPEAASIEQLQAILAGTQIDILLLDYALKHKFGSLTDTIQTYFIANSHNDPNNFNNISGQLVEQTRVSILEEHGICFSSGTSENIKKITLKFDSPVEEKKRFEFKDIIRFIEFKTSFWSRKDNRMIIYMPFSHVQQRSFLYQCLLNRINIILSDPQNCIKHIIIEKPNIMVSVPVVYEMMAKRIEAKTAVFQGAKKTLYNLYKWFKIYNWSELNPIKKIISSILFKDIKKVWGGKADYFVTGSAPIPKAVLITFLNVGVKIYEAYGQTESSIIAINTTKNYKIGSVGKPVVEIKISDESEILIKYDEEKYAHNSSALITNHGYIHTGDLGYLDKDGFLHLTGRKDNVIVLKTGKKIHPEQIEKELNAFPFIKHCVVCSIDGERINSIISLEGPINEFAFAQVRSAIREVNEQFAEYQKITSFLISSTPFTSDNGFLTATLKVRRKVVIENFKGHKFEHLHLLHGNDN